MMRRAGEFVGDKARLNVEPRPDRGADPQARQGDGAEPPVEPLAAHPSHRSNA